MSHLTTGYYVSSDGGGGCTMSHLMGCEGRYLLASMQKLGIQRSLLALLQSCCLFTEWQNQTERKLLKTFLHFSLSLFLL